MADATPEPVYEPYQPTYFVVWMADPVPVKRKKKHMVTFGFVPICGGKPSKGTSADKRLASNKPKPSKPKGK